MVLHLIRESCVAEGQSAEEESLRLRNLFEGLFAADGVQGKFVPIADEAEVVTSILLLYVIASEKADYAIMQPSLKADGEISICTQDLITKSDCNIVCCRH